MVLNSHIDLVKLMESSYPMKPNENEVVVSRFCDYLQLGKEFLLTRGGFLNLEQLLIYLDLEPH